jgi:hypothetical protein
MSLELLPKSLDGRLVNRSSAHGAGRRLVLFGMVPFQIFDAFSTKFMPTRQLFRSRRQAVPADGADLSFGGSFIRRVVLRILILDVT